MPEAYSLDLRERTARFVGSAGRGTLLRPIFKVPVSFAAEQTEPRIDVGRENIQELVDDAAAAHPQCSLDMLAL